MAMRLPEVPAGAQDREILKVSFVVEEGREDGPMRVLCDVSAFRDPYRTGMILAMAGRIVLEALRAATGGNSALMEQAQAQMTEGFVRDMELPDAPSRVEHVE